MKIFHVLKRSVLMIISPLIYVYALEALYFKSKVMG